MRLQAHPHVLSYRQHAIMIAAALALLVSCLLPWAANAKPDEWNVQGMNGELHLQGMLAEGPCQLDMRSVYQEVPLPPIAPASLLRPGDRGQSVIFTLKLRDCMASGGGQTDLRTGTQTWDARQPVVAVTFSGVTDPDSSELLKAEGVSGIGLRITDSEQKDVRTGSRGRPQFVAPGQDQLVFYVAAERTPAPLIMGEYRATADFRLNYE